jgi:hypothetical protein
MTLTPQARRAGGVVVPGAVVLPGVDPEVVIIIGAVIYGDFVQGMCILLPHPDHLPEIDPEVVAVAPAPREVPGDEPAGRPGRTGRALRNLAPTSRSIGERYIEESTENADR